MTNNEIIIAYNKTVKVILSCKTFGHLQSAVRYKKNFEKQLPDSYLWIRSNLDNHIAFKLNMLRKRF